MASYSLTGCGGIGNATGANFLLKTPDMQILVDCGLVQGSRFAMDENRMPFTYDPTKVSYLLVTHAHMDHIGRIPKLVKEGFTGTIYSTPETKELASIMLEDAFGLLLRESKNSGKPTIYEREDIGRALALWKTVPYHENVEIARGFSIYLRDAGHILGSAIIEVSLQREGDKPMKIAFTGDLGNSPTPLLRDTEYVTDADYVVMESVYGDRNHESKDFRDARLRQILADTLTRGGTAVIPTFSIERTQVILYEINNFIESKTIPQVSVFLDSPLALKVTQVYKNHIEHFNDKIQEAIKGGDDIFDFPGLKIVGDHKQSQSIDGIPGPKIILAGSGMSVGGRVLQHERTFLEDPKSTILLVGYQVAGSIGRQIEEGVKHITIDGVRVAVKSHIEKIGGYSSHKDSNNLVEFASHALPKAKKIFVAMGENKSSSFLAQRLRSEIGANAIVPEKDKEYDLI